MTRARWLAAAGLATWLLSCLWGQVIAVSPARPVAVPCRPAISVEGRLVCGDGALAGLGALCGPGFAGVADPGAADRDGAVVSLAAGCPVLGRIAGPELLALGVRIDLNAASVAELESLPGIGPVLARRIVEARPLSRVDDLLRVSGIGAVRMAKLRPHVLVRL